jgi:hypothetical protein
VTSDNLSDRLAGGRAIIYDHHFELVAHRLRIERG